MSHSAYETFLNRLQKLDTLNILSDYIDHYTPVVFHCNECNKTFNATPKRMYTWSECPKCASLRAAKLKRTNYQEFDIKIKNMFPNIKLLTQYITAKEPIDCYCNICKNQWRTTPDRLLKGKGCKFCSKRESGLRRRKTEKQFLEELKNINPNIEVVGKYNGAGEKIECKCKICSTEWNPRASHLLEGIGCPECFMPHGERKIRDFLNMHSIEYVSQHSYNDLIGIHGGFLSYDFYLPYYNLLIEFQGKQHEEPIEYFGGYEYFKIQQEHDRMKREYAIQHSIQLLEIWYYDEYNIDKILNNYLFNNTK